MFRILLLCSFLLLGACSNHKLTFGLGTESALLMTESFQKALEESKSGFSSSWYNSDTNTSGTVTVISTYYRYNKPCREFIATIHGNKGTQNRYGDACRYGQYNWRLIRF